MTIGWTLFLWAAALPVLPILYFVQKNECKPKKNIIVGVTLPYEAHSDPSVLASLERYKRELKLICWGFLAAVIPSLFIRSFGVFMTFWFTWTILLCTIFFIPHIRCNTALRRLKEERGWKRSDTPQVVTDLKAAAEEMRRISPWWFLPPFLISLVPLCFDRELWWLWILDAALIPIFYACYRWLYRNRAEVVDNDTDRTLALTRIRRYNWGKCWLILAWATGAFNVGLWLTLGHIWLLMAVILAYSLAACVSVIGIEFRVRRLQEKLTKDSGQGYYVDEDDHWIWGMLYYNPNDARLLVNDRVGMSTSLNLARRPAQIIMGLCLALLLACPLFGVWIIGDERAPVELELTETELTGSHYGRRWSVALADIQSVELLEELPQLLRVSGTGMDSAMTGTYRSDEWGRLTCCIDPRTGPWLLMTQVDGNIYLLGSSTEGEVEKILSELN